VGCDATSGPLEGFTLFAQCMDVISCRGIFIPTDRFVPIWNRNAVVHKTFSTSLYEYGWSTGGDAQPYFRVVNPVTQSEKSDAQGTFIRRCLPQLAALPDKAIHAPWLAASPPIVPHEEARKKTLDRYAVVKAHRPCPARTAPDLPGVIFSRVSHIYLRNTAAIH